MATILEKVKKSLRSKYRYRSAETGEFVGRLYALLHPATTVREKVE